MDIGKQLKQLRERAGYAQAKDFAEAAGIPYSRYIAYENKGTEPKLAALCKISETLGISIDELLGNGRFERCKRLVESTYTMKVYELRDGRIRVTFSYDKEKLLAVYKKAILNHLDQGKLNILQKEDKFFASREEFCDQVEKADLLFHRDEDMMERWEKLFDGVYIYEQSIKEFNEKSCVPLEGWQIKSISSCMMEELLDTRPESRTPEKIKEKQNMIDQFFKGRQAPHLAPVSRFPSGFGELLRDFYF